MLRRFFVVSFFLTLSGCALLSDDGPMTLPAPLVDFEPSIQVEGLVQWTAEAGDGLDDEQFLQLQPAVIAQMVITSDPENGVTAFNLNNGDVLWHTPLTGVPIASGPGANRDFVMVGSSQGEVIALNRADGKEMWRTQVSSEVLTPPQIGQGVAVVRTLDGKLFGLDVNNGSRLWVYERSVPVLTLRGISTPLIISDAVIAGFDNGKLAAVRLADGALLWEISIAVPRGRSQLERMVDIDGSPLVIGDVLYVASYQGRIVAMELFSGRTLWERDISAYSSLGGDTNYVYVSDADNQVWAFDRFSGEAAWKQGKLSGRLLTAPVSTGRFVVVGDLEGYLHWMRTDDGQFVGRYQTDNSRILVEPVLADNYLVVYNNSGQVTTLAIP